ncbi:MAG: hypothetical protein ACYDHF_06230 [Candidatus Cryosericum sp.]
MNCTCPHCATWRQRLGDWLLGQPGAWSTILLILMVALIILGTSTLGPTVDQIVYREHPGVNQYDRKNLP